MPGAAVERYAPRFAHVLPRIPVTVPSVRAASSRSVMWSRPWIVAR